MNRDLQQRLGGWVVSAAAFIFLLGTPAATVASDSAWYDQTPYKVQLDPSSTTTSTAEFITVEDGTRLAATVHLPAEALAGERVPTVLLQTRYWRDSSEGLWSARFYTQRGYAYVAVDVRGTGASFGTRRYELGPEEIADGKDVVTWIASRPWSNGKIAAVGGSYTGATAAYLMSHAQPQLRAAIPGQIAFDLFENVFFPGGVYSQNLMTQWQFLVGSLDRREGIAAQVPGLNPVDADSDGALLTAALTEHAGNFLINDVLSTVDFRDDVRPDALGDPMRAGDMTMHVLGKSIERSDAAMLNLSGWFDGSLQMGAIHRHLRFPSPDNRLVLGPWDHKNTYVSPWREEKKQWGSQVTQSDFDLWAHYARFLDRHLRGEKDPNELPVHYFTMGEEKWKAAKTWPPEGLVKQTRYFDADGRLGSPEAEPKAPGRDRYEVDRTASTGFDNRWNSIVNLEGRKIGYFEREEQQPKLLTYTTSPLDSPIEVTGHARVHLFVASTATDGAFHVYLEDVAPDGEVRYVTEGVLRASHRKTSPSPYPSPVLFRSHLREDHRPLVPGETVELAIDLYPTSYRFPAGHSIRVGLAGADATMFEAIPADGEPPVWQVHRGAATPSRVVLPVMPPVEGEQ